MFKCLGPAHISLQIPPEAAHELAARHGFEGVELGSRWASAHVWPGSDERTLEPNLEFHAERLRPVVETLGEHRIKFGIEFVGTPSLRA